jgi:Cof subfamily protein (haloacid dehalogenase superfamily)
MLVFDLDGTVVWQNDHKTITDKTFEAIEYAAEKGVVVVIATGRMLSGIQDFLKENKNIKYLITTNGSKLINLENKEVMYCNPLSYSKVKELSEKAEELGLFYELYCDGKSYAPRKNKENIRSYNIHKEWFDMLNDRPIPFENLEDLIIRDKKEVEKFNMLSIPYEDYNKVWDEFKKIDGINQVSSIKINIEINNETTSKWAALKHLLQVTGIKEDEVMTIGDSGNDYEMIKRAGLGVAMGNAFDEVKGVAKYITDDDNEDGFAKAVYKFI